MPGEIPSSTKSIETTPAVAPASVEDAESIAIKNEIIENIPTAAEAGIDITPEEEAKIDAEITERLDHKKEFAEGESQFIVKKMKIDKTAGIVASLEIDLANEPDEAKKAETAKKLEKVKADLDKSQEVVNTYNEDVSAEKLAEKVDTYIESVGIKKTTPEDMETQEEQLEMAQPLNDKSAEKIQTIVNGKISELYGSEIRLNAEGKEIGSRNPEKANLLANETKRYMELVQQAIAEGTISPDITAADVLDLAQENVFNIAYQDKKAVESSLGDHGVRHITHNITRCEEIFQQLEANGHKVSAIDKLAAHQIMTMHDIGYAFDVDKGHNAMSAKVASEQLINPSHPISKIFKGEMAKTIHDSVLNHDSSDVEFHMADDSPEGRRKNVESAVHLADNLHAFETKLPEVLYSIPATLETMLLLKSAGESGASAEEIEQIKADLIGNIDAIDGISPDDKESMKKAAAELKGDSYRFMAGRMCGTNPEITVDANGNVNIDVQESAIHQEVVQLFGLQEYAQLRKFMGDLVGLEMDDPKIDAALSEGHISGDKLPVTINTKLIPKNYEAGGEAVPNKSDYEEKIEQLIQDVSLAEFGKMDLGDSKLQVGLEKDLKTTTDPNIIAQIQVQIDELKTQRSQRRLQFLQSKQGLPNVA